MEHFLGFLDLLDTQIMIISLYLSVLLFLILFLIFSYLIKSIGK